MDLKLFSEQTLHNNSKPTVVFYNQPGGHRELGEQLSMNYACIEVRDINSCLNVLRKNNADLLIIELTNNSIAGTLLDQIHIIRNDRKIKAPPTVIYTSQHCLQLRLQLRLQLLDIGVLDVLYPQPSFTECLLKIRNIIAQYLRLEGKKPDFTNQTTEESVDNRNFLEQCNLLLSKNYSQPNFNATEMANCLNLSTKQLQRKCQKYLGKTPTDYIRSFRLNVAATHLKLDCPATCVCYDVGFSNYTSFRRSFKAQFGQSPTAFQFQ